MTVRIIKKEELSKLLPLYKHLHDNDTDVEIGVLDKVWETIQDNDAHTYFVIEQNNLFVSSCNLTVIPNLTRGGKSISLIENVVTHRDYRNRGLGRLVIEAALGHARSKNCYKVMLFSGSHRVDSHKFYNALGFNSDDKVGFSMKL
jgi:GNAT superfamily N-acetyltransferase